MRCIRPIKAWINISGDIVYTKSINLKAQTSLEFECRKCLPCRLNGAREKAIRAVHEAKMHEGNIFLTLTYNDESLASERLIYEDFQLFMKKLRNTTSETISYMVTGEYGDENKRPHWHAIIFNYWPDDAKSHRETKDLKHQVWTSETINQCWDKGYNEFGQVTIESAGYVARYAAKKLVHGNDQDHDYHPLHKTSSRRAIGRSWIEQYHNHTFQNGYVNLPNGQQTKIPRYYVDWAKKHHPELYNDYVTNVLPKIIHRAEVKQRKEEIEYFAQLWDRRKKGQSTLDVPTRSRVKLTILEKKFKQLQEHNKL